MLNKQLSCHRQAARARCRWQFCYVTLVYVTGTNDYESRWNDGQHIVTGPEYVAS